MIDDVRRDLPMATIEKGFLSESARGSAGPSYSRPFPLLYRNWPDR
jgi:hypothetical protein